MDTIDDLLGADVGLSRTFTCIHRTMGELSCDIAINRKQSNRLSEVS